MAACAAEPGPVYLEAAEEWENVGSMMCMTYYIIIVVLGNCQDIVYGFQLRHHPTSVYGFRPSFVYAFRCCRKHCLWFPSFLWFPLSQVKPIFGNVSGEALGVVWFPYLVVLWFLSSQETCFVYGFRLSLFNGFRVATAPPVSNCWKLCFNKIITPGAFPRTTKYVYVYVYIYIYIYIHIYTYT